METINRDVPSWDYELYHRFTSVVDAFHNYTNVLGFIVGTEVANSLSATRSMAFVKAAARDMEMYMANMGYRKIPVGYATSDDGIIRQDLGNYLNSGKDDEATDFHALNLYS